MTFMSVRMLVLVLGFVAATAGCRKKAPPVTPLALGKASPACQKFKNNNIQRIHLNDRENEYNTYTNEGLPPGPIANPGRGSLAAVMKPDGSNFLYYVGAGGVTYFSPTQAEHEAKVSKYLLGGRPMRK